MCCIVVQKIHVYIYYNRVGESGMIDMIEVELIGTEEDVPPNTLLLRLQVSHPRKANWQILIINIILAEKNPSIWWLGFGHICVPLRLCRTTMTFIQMWYSMSAVSSITNTFDYSSHSLLIQVVADSFFRRLIYPDTRKLALYVLDLLYLF